MKTFRYAVTVVIAVSMLLLLTGCEDQPVPTDEAVLAAAGPGEVPDIEILGAVHLEPSERLVRTVYGRYFPEIIIEIIDGTLLAWNLNSQNLRLPPQEGAWVRSPGHEPQIAIPHFTNPLELVDGENELIIWAIGSTEFIVERRFIITSNQTIPEEQRTTMPRLNNVTISYYDPEFPTVVTVAFEFIGDYYGNVLRASANANHPSWDGTQEDVDVTDKGGGVFEVTVEMYEYSGMPGHFSRNIRITLENEWYVPSWGEVSIASGIGTGRPGIGWIACSNIGGWVPQPPRWD